MGFQDLIHINLLDVSLINIDTHWASRNVRSGYWRIYINDRSGASVVLEDDTVYPIEPGAAHLIPAWVGFSCRNTRRIGHRFAHFDVIGMPPGKVQRLFPRPLPVAAEHFPPAIFSGFADASEAWRMAIHAKALIFTALTEILPDTPDGAPALLTDPGPVAAAVALLENDPGARLTNTDLARQCHMSVDYFGRVFRRRMGQTPASYRLDQRIAAATQLLVFSDDSIEHIAERLGFANRFHFSRMFTRRMGIAPATYRKQAKV